MTLKFAAAALAAGLAMPLTLSVPSHAAMPAGPVMTADHGLVIHVAKKKKRMTRQQELDRSIDNGTVPSRYRRDVPKQYQQYIPFERR